jgi:hypothetical protein
MTPPRRRRGNSKKPYAVHIKTGPTALDQWRKHGRYRTPEKAMRVLTEQAALHPVGVALKATGPGGWLKHAQGTRS